MYRGHTHGVSAAAGCAAFQKPLLSRALADEDRVLWIDADVIAWRDHGKLHMDDLRAEGDLVRLDSVGGTMLLVKAGAHRDGLIFPPYLYGCGSALIRENNFMSSGQGEIETEGLGIMASDMGYECWGMPNLEVLHHPG